MTAKTSAEKEKKQTEHQQSLKGVLADVITRSQQPATNKQQPTQHAAAEPRVKRNPLKFLEDVLREVLKGEA